MLYDYVLQLAPYIKHCNVTVWHHVDPQQQQYSYAILLNAHLIWIYTCVVVYCKYVHGIIIMYC